MLIQVFMVYDCLVVSGGATKGLSILGSLHCLVEQGKLDLSTIKIYASSSIGSAISLLLACGYTPYELFEEILHIKNFFKREKKDWEKYGLEKIAVQENCSITCFLENMSQLLYMKGLENCPTFQELYDMLGVELIVTAVNVTKLRLEYFSKSTHPNMNCLEAVKLSCNIPLIFKRAVFEDCEYVDGGLMNNLPIEIVKEKSKNILAINISSTDPITDESNVYSYILTLWSIPFACIGKLRRNELTPDDAEIIDLYVSKTGHSVFNVLNTVEDDTKYELFLTGYSQTLHYRKPEYLFLEIN